MHQHPLPGRYFETLQGVVCRNEDFGNGGGSRKGKAFGNRHGVGDRSENVLGVSTATHDPHHPICQRDTIDAFAESIHLAGMLQAGNVCWRVGRCRMQAAPLQEIGTVDAECAYAHSDLTRAGFGYGDVSYLEDLWSAWLVYDDSSHASMDLRSLTPHRNCKAYSAR
jgi:hypothetical protein